MPNQNTVIVAAYTDPSTTPPSSGGGSTGQTPGEPESPGDPGDPGDVSHILNTTDHMQYVQGVGNNIFQPGRDMTRAETAQLFYNLLLDKDIDITKQFPDVPQDKWYALPVGTLASLGLIDGYPDGTYRPDGNMTRAEFTAITVKFAAAFPEIAQDSPFNDVVSDHWAFKHIMAAVSFNWVEGYGDGRFAPEDFITRAEVVTLVNRMLKRVPDSEYIDAHAELLRFDDVPGTYWQYYGIMEAFHAHEYDRLDDGGEKWLS